MNEFIIINDEKLYFDKILFETYIPILFVCKNDKKELFICVCCQDNSNVQKWLISRINPIKITEMLKDKISIRDAFLSDPTFRISVNLVNGKLQIEYNNSDWLDGSEFLPKKGAYIEAEPGEYDEEIKYYLEYTDLKYSDPMNTKTIIKSRELTNDVLSSAELSDLYEIVSSNIIYDASSSNIASTCIKTIKKISAMTFDNKLSSYDMQKVNQIYKMFLKFETLNKIFNYDVNVSDNKKSEDEKRDKVIIEITNYPEITLEAA